MSEIFGNPGLEGIGDLEMTPELTEVLYETEDAYSRSRYGEDLWQVCAQRLLDAGASVPQAIWLMNSKYMRYAADMAESEEGYDIAIAFAGYFSASMVGLVAEAQRDIDQGTWPACKGYGRG